MLDAKLPVDELESMLRLKVRLTAKGHACPMVRPRRARLYHAFHL